MRQAPFAMDLKQLRTLLAIAESGSVTTAADMLHIVQPAVSRQLRLLEEELGSPLFERGRRGMQLTDAGHVLVAHARRALRELDRARAQIVPAPGEVSGAVTLGLLPSTSTLLTGPLVSELRGRYPRLAVRVVVGYTGHLQQWLENGDLDVALLYGSSPSSLLEVYPMLDEVLCAVGAPGSVLQPGKPVRLADLAKLPLILPQPPHGLRRLVEEACKAAGSPLEIVAETNAMSVQKELAIWGQGYTVLPSVSVVDDVARGVLVAVPIMEPELQRRLVLALPTTRHASTATRSVHAAMRSIIRQFVAEGRWAGGKSVEAEMPGAAETPASLRRAGAAHALPAQ